jgi:D-glycero-alpha-D-manno-heptose-7-phosphate kinase
MATSASNKHRAARNIVIGRAPARISFFGGGTDYPDWFRQYGGTVLSATINRYSYTVGSLSITYLEKKAGLWLPFIGDQGDDYERSVVTKILRHLEAPAGVDIRTGCDTRRGSGLGTSATSIVSLLGCAYRLFGIGFDKEKLANDAIHVERHLLERSVGNQDHVAASYGGLNQITFTQEGRNEVKRLTVSASRLQELESYLRIVHTGRTRNSAEVARTYALDKPIGVTALKALSAMVDRAIAIVESDEDLSEFGALLDEAWRQKKKLSPFISNAAVDKLYEMAKAEGAIGGKLLGAGGGGFLLLFASPSSHERIQRRLAPIRLEPITLDTSGFESWICTS